jgi:hypothetical protein
MGDCVPYDEWRNPDSSSSKQRLGKTAYSNFIFFMKFTSNINNSSAEYRSVAE